MAKTFTPDKTKWGVKISVERRATRSSTTQRSPRRQVVIQSPRLSNASNANSERWYVELVNFIGQSKREVEFQAQFLIDSVQKWQHKTKKHFDVIQQKLIREHNLQSPSSTVCENSTEPIVQSSIEPVTQRATKRIVSKAKNNVCFPSMPVLLTETECHDNLAEFLSTPSPSIPSKLGKVSKRRNTVCATTLASEKKSLDFAVRKASRATHSSVLAMSTNRPDTATKPKSQVNVVAVSTFGDNCDSNSHSTPDSNSNSTPDSNSNSIGNNNSKKTSIKPCAKPKSAKKSAYDNIKRMFLETKKIVSERQKQREQKEGMKSLEH